MWGGGVVCHPVLSPVLTGIWAAKNLVVALQNRLSMWGLQGYIRKHFCTVAMVPCCLYKIQYYSTRPDCSVYQPSAC
jgi:hypothetical protein